MSDDINPGSQDSESLARQERREQARARNRAKNLARKEAKIRNREAQTARKLRSVIGGAFGKETGFAFNRLAVGTTASTKPDDNKSLHHPRKRGTNSTDPPEAA